MSGRTGKWITTSVLIVLGVIWVGGIALILHGMGSALPSVQAQPAATSPGVPQKQVHLTLQTFPNTPTDAWMTEHHYQFGQAAIPPFATHEDWVRYGPVTNLVVPAHALVTITIENYDGQTPILNPFYSHVQGTLDGKMTVDGKSVTGLDPSVISHTFTIHSIPSDKQPWLYVSVPIQGEPDNVESAGADNGFPPHPIVIQFSFVTGDAGSYMWQCFDPCGTQFNGFGGPMSTRGYMSGTFTVQG